MAHLQSVIASQIQDEIIHGNARHKGDCVGTTLYVGTDEFGF